MLNKNKRSHGTENHCSYMISLGLDSQKVLSKNCHSFKRKVSTVQEFCHKVKTFFCLDKMGFTKGLRQKFVLYFVITLRPLPGRLKSFLKYSITYIYILPFVMLTKNILRGSILPIKVISVDCNRNLQHLITYKFPHFCGKKLST